MAEEKQRRGHNQGSVFVRRRLRKDGRETVRYGFAVTANGKQVQRLFKTARERDRALAAAISGQTMISASIPLSKYLEAWLDQVVKVRRRASTYDLYTSWMRNHIIPGLGHVRLDKLSPMQVERFLTERLKSGLSPVTVNNLRAALIAALSAAVKRELLQRNPASLVDPFEVKGRARPRLTVEQAKAVLAALRGERYEALFVTALITGLREGEILGLRWDDLDFERQVLSVHQQVQRRGGTYQAGPTKTRFSRRDIPLPVVLVDLYRRQKVRQNEERLAAGSDWQRQEWDLVFTTAVGRPINPSVLRRHLGRILTAASVEPMRFHDLRGSAATFLAALGVPPRIAMAILGHSAIATTMQVYADALPSAMREAMEAMGALLLEPPTAMNRQ